EIELLCRRFQGLKGEISLLDGPADDVMGHAEGETVIPHEGIGKLGCRRESLASFLFHTVSIKRGAGKHVDEEAQAFFSVPHPAPDVGGELLEVAVVAHGETLD